MMHIRHRGKVFPNRILRKNNKSFSWKYSAVPYEKQNYSSEPGQGRKENNSGLHHVFICSCILHSEGAKKEVIRKLLICFNPLTLYTIITGKSGWHHTLVLPHLSITHHSLTCEIFILVKKLGYLCKKGKWFCVISKSSFQRGVPSYKMVSIGAPGRISAQIMPRLLVGNY